MSLRSLLPLLLAAALAAPASTLAADAAVTVTAIVKKEVNAFDEKGAPLPAPIPASAFKLPITTSAVGPAGSIGLPYQGKTVYVRKIDLTTAAAGACAKLAETETRSAGAVKAGERMGAGQSDNCLVAP